MLATSVVSGCTSVYFCAAGGDLIYPTPEEGRPFEIIGPVHALVWQWVFVYYLGLGPTYHEAEITLIAEARKMGADAVIDVQFYTEGDTDETSLSHLGMVGLIPFIINTRGYHMSGLAIRYTDGRDE